MKKSILSNERACYWCKTTQDLHRHHIFFGRNRKASDQHGCWCYLCGKHHNLSNEGVHFNREMDLILRKECQQAFEELYSHEKFMEVFKVNYL